MGTGEMGKTEGTNKELIEILAKEFGIHKNDVKIISGKRSKNKIIRLCGVDSTYSGLEK